MMGATVNQKRLIILIIICLLTLLALTWTIRQRKQPPNPAVVFNPKRSVVALGGPDLRVQRPQSWGAKESSDLGGAKPTVNSLAIGRADPFAQLPEEQLDNPAFPDTPAQRPTLRPEPPDQPVLPLPELTQPPIRVCGIMMGKMPVAYVELPGSGSGYRRIALGDRIAGGRVKEITATSVRVERHGVTVTYNLGE